MGALKMSGVILIILGVIGFAIPIFSTLQTRDVATLGDLKLQTTETVSYAIPPMASAGAVVFGVLLFGLGLYRR